MARETLANGESLSDTRAKINAMFQEVYQDLVAGLSFRGILNTGDSVTGAPARGYFYIVEDAGTYGSVVCTAGDWLFYSTTWEVLSSTNISAQQVGWTGIKETQNYADGTKSPTSTDPLEIETVTHVFAKEYLYTPNAVLVPKCDWALYVVSVTRNATTNIVTVVVGIGSSGSNATDADMDYDLHLF